MIEDKFIKYELEVIKEAKNYNFPIIDINNFNNSNKSKFLDMSREIGNHLDEMCDLHYKILSTKIANNTKLKTLKDIMTFLSFPEKLSIQILEGTKHLTLDCFCNGFFIPETIILPNTVKFALSFIGHPLIDIGITYSYLSYVPLYFYNKFSLLYKKEMLKKFLFSEEEFDKVYPACNLYFNQQIKSYNITF
ncbi:MAG: hypothetical protein LBU40_06305 [Methanobrevibacter sp.]|jgi:hypothetical protein|nr:hypothetical protein [Methanobrevibacter sp.]